MSFRTVEKSQTLLLNEQSRQLQADGVDVIKFGFGQSPFSPPDNVIEEYKKYIDYHFYSPVQGLPQLCEAVAEFHNKIDGLDIQAADVLIAPGSKMLIYAAIGMFEGVDVLIPAPAWVSYAPQAILWAQQVVRIDTSFAEKWNITPDSLERAITGREDNAKDALLILNYPGNPSGVTYTADELQAIADICRKYGVYVVSDEIYGLLHHAGRHVSLMHYYPERTLVTTGLSKWCGAGGWRIGALLLDSALAKQVKHTLLGIASETYSCNSTPAQYAAIAAYCFDGHMARYVECQRRIIKAIGQQVATMLREVGVNVHTPEGGFYLLPDFSPFADKLRNVQISNSQQLCSRLLADTGVALLPADAFGLRPDILAARLAYVDFDGKTALQAAMQQPTDAMIDTDFINRYAPKVVEGAQRICNWLSSL